MDDKVFIFSVSSNFIAEQLIAIPESLYNNLSIKFKAKDNECKFIIVSSLDNILGDSYKFYSYKIFDHNFLPISELEGIYKLTKDDFKEDWTGKWSNKVLTLTFQSDIFDKYKIDILSNSGHLKTVQQIAFVLEVINGRQTKLTSYETAEIRSKLDGYLNVKSI